MEFGVGADQVVEDLATPIRAWRVWKVGFDREGWNLRSNALTVEGVCRGVSYCAWPTGGMEARCYCAQMQHSRWYEKLPSPEVRRHPQCPGPPASPSRMGNYPDGYGCGIYGMRSYGGLLETHWHQGAHVIGRVELGGRVWEHVGGWRAQYARPVGLAHALPALARTFNLDPGGRRLEDVLRELRRRYDCLG